MLSRQDLPDPPRLDRLTREFNSVEEASQWAGHAVNPQLKWLFIQPRKRQRSEEWLNERDNAITASDWYTACRSLCGRIEIFKKKLSVRTPYTHDAEVNMEHGRTFEDCAAHMFEQITGKKIIDFGYIQYYKLWQMKPDAMSSTDWVNILRKPDRPESVSEADWKTICDYRWIGGSPDGVLTDGAVIEIKCPRSGFHESMKPEYRWQLYLNMALCGATKGYYIQYYPPLPMTVAEMCIVEVTLPEKWFEIQRERARPAWEWVMEFRRTGQLPADLSEFISIGEINRDTGKIVNFIANPMAPVPSERNSNEAYYLTDRALLTQPGPNVIKRKATDDPDQEYDFADLTACPWV